MLVSFSFFLTSFFISFLCLSQASQLGSPEIFFYYCLSSHTSQSALLVSAFVILVIVAPNLYLTPSSHRSKSRARNQTFQRHFHPQSRSKSRVIVPFQFSCNQLFASIILENDNQYCFCLIFMSTEVSYSEASPTYRDSKKLQYD